MYNVCLKCYVLINLLLHLKEKKKVSQHPLPNNADSEIRVGPVNRHAHKFSDISRLSR
jgi:hypothetical protein